MGIKLTTPSSEIEGSIKSSIDRSLTAVTNTLRYIGERTIQHVRSLPSPNPADFPSFPHIPPHQPHYIDWTSNLRNSIGYVVVIDGDIVDEGGFDMTLGGAQGKKTGGAYAKSLARQYPQGMALIVVAGMNYASYVANKGYDVVDSAELLAEDLANRLLKQPFSEQRQ